MSAEVTPDEALQEALVALVIAAMMSGYWCIKDRAEAAKQHYYDNPECSGSDMLEAALRDFPSEFLTTRASLTDPIRALLAENGELRAALKAAECPRCNGYGYITSSPNGEVADADRCPDCDPAERTKTPVPTLPDPGKHERFCG